MAYTMGATWIERHYTLDKTWKGTDHQLSITRKEVDELMKLTRQIDLIKGDENKEILPCEQKSIYKLRYDLKP